jgi:hypothetical protein
VGAVVGVLVVALIAWFCWRRNRRRNETQQQQPPGELPAGQYPHHTASTGIKSSYGGSTSYGSPHNDMSQYSVPPQAPHMQVPTQELEAQGRPHELAGASQYGAWQPPAGQAMSRAELDSAASSQAGMHYTYSPVSTGGLPPPQAQQYTQGQYNNGPPPAVL